MYIRISVPKGLTRGYLISWSETETPRITRWSLGHLDYLNHLDNLNRLDYLNHLDNLNRLEYLNPLDNLDARA